MNYRFKPGQKVRIKNGLIPYREYMVDVEDDDSNTWRNPIFLTREMANLGGTIQTVQRPANDSCNGSWFFETGQVNAYYLEFPKGDPCEGTIWPDSCLEPIRGFNKLLKKVQI